MKKTKKIISIAVAFLCVSVFMCGCGNGTSILKNLSVDASPSIKKVSGSLHACADGFASDIAVVPLDAKNSSGSDKLYSEAALLIDVDDGQVIFQKNAHHKEYPASTTKILTSYIALKYGDKTASRKIGDEVIINEDNVVMCDFREGDEIPFDVIIHGAMMRSGNDAAAALALFTADSLDDFSDIMNKEAKAIGATESHFVNPHGLYDDNHYTTAYDMYLIFNEAIKNPDFVDVLSCKSYSGSFNRSTSYRSYVINASYTNSNQYVCGLRMAPEHIKVIGGKAGYTKKAGRSYVMLAEANGHRYIFVTMRCNDANEMYSDLDFLLNLIPDNSKKSDNTHNNTTEVQSGSSVDSTQDEKTDSQTTQSETKSNDRDDD